MYLDRRLWEFTRGVRLRILWAVLVGLLAVAVGIARLALLGWLLARVIARDPLASLLLPAALAAVAILLRGALEYGRTMVAHHTATIVQAALRRAIYQRVTALGPAHFTLVRTGDVILSMVEGVQQLEVYFGQYLPQLAVAALTPFLIFACVAFVDLPIAFVLLAAALVTLVAPAAWHRLDSRNSRARQQAYAAFGAEFLDSVQGLGTLKAFGQSGARAKVLADKGQALFRRTMGVLGTNTLARGITDTGIAIGAAVALGWGAYRVRAGEMDLAGLLIVLMLGVEVFRPLRELRILLHQGMLGISAAQGIFNLLDARPPVDDRAERIVDDAGLPPTVAFERVTFAYPGGRRPAHDGLSFTVAAGERVGIVGPSGSGKSTVAKLLLRFYDAQAGRVLVGGRDVRDLQLDQLRSRLAVVNQDTFLFHGTVEDNLRMGRPDATAAELAAAARAANAEEFIARLPQGYQTVVGERGVKLSGGQRQRIAIARALLRDAPILILDEALSSVDAESEAVIQEALDRLMQGRTTLIFAHRLSSVIGADRILALDEGKVAESGTHAELMARGSVYHRLMAAQSQDGAGDADLVASPRPSDRDGAAEGRETDAILEPTDAIIRAEGMGWWQLLGVLSGLIAGYRGKLAVTFVLGVLRVVSLIGIGVLSALAVRAVKHGDPPGGFLIALGIVAPLAGLLHWLESWLAHDTAYRLLADMRLDMFRKLDALAPAYLTRRRSGDLVGVATHDIELIEYFFAHTVTPAFVAVLVPLGVLVTLWTFGPALAFVLLPFLVYAALTPVLGRATIDRLGSRAREVSGDLNAHAVDSVQGLGEIVAFQQVGRRGREQDGKAEEYLKARMPFLRDLTLQTARQEIATGLGGLAVILTGAALVGGGRLDSGILPLLTLLAMSAFVPVWEIAQVGRQLADTLGATRRVYAVHAEPVTVTDGPGVGQDGLPTTTALEMSGVSFAYPGRRRRALAGVSFSVPAGSTVALVGPSGAGKTTVANLFLRFWDPDEGTVRMNGHDLKEYGLDDLRRRIALVAQDTYLFNDTLGNNILLARPGASPAELMSALEKASLADLVSSLPDGLDTIVGERGAQLSGGQRQRVAIARAFLKDAPILILDEATSHLDAVNEQAVRAALDLLSRDRTTVVIAHRLSTVRDADRIIVLEEGRVAEIGSHRVLLDRRGLYARLVSRQLMAAGGSRV
ncbi:MAG TPA: ABC transporter ATP-binding protein [Candidatus Methylomirabilis sp.]|nr:ABC transporter ATP-binding protein [Candidatus Methylomirabilis sp.]